MKKTKCINAAIVPVAFAVLLNLAACGGNSASAQSEAMTELCNDQAYLTDLRDGQTYRIVAIGSQVWMAENLNYEVEHSFCYDDFENNCTKYGRLYVWSASVGKTEDECGCGNKCSLLSGNIQGVCPSGWHLPSRAEWDTLVTAVGGEVLAGKNLKTSSRWGPNGNGTDSFGFSALPAGYWGMEIVGRGNSVLHFEPGYAQPYYDSMGDYTAFWSSTEFDESLAYSINLTTDYDDVKLYPMPKYLGYSIRCVKDR